MRFLWHANSRMRDNRQTGFPRFRRKVHERRSNFRFECYFYCRTIKTNMMRSPFSSSREMFPHTFQWIHARLYVLASGPTFSFSLQIIIWLFPFAVELLRLNPLPVVVSSVMRCAVEIGAHNLNAWNAYRISCITKQRTEMRTEMEKMIPSFRENLQWFHHIFFLSVAVKQCAKLMRFAWFSRLNYLLTSAEQCSPTLCHVPGYGRSTMAHISTPSPLLTLSHIWRQRDVADLHQIYLEIGRPGDRVTLWVSGDAFRIENWYGKIAAATRTLPFTEAKRVLWSEVGQNAVLPQWRPNKWGVAESLAEF